MKPIHKLSDDELLDGVIFWFRVGRNEDGLHGKERERYQELCAEIRKRGLLDEMRHKPDLENDTLQEPGKAINLSATDRARMNRSKPGVYTKPGCSRSENIKSKSKRAKKERFDAHHM